MRLFCKRLASTYFYFLSDRKWLVPVRNYKFFNTLTLESGPNCSRSFPKGTICIYPFLVLPIDFSNIQPQQLATDITFLLEAYDSTHICAASYFLYDKLPEINQIQVNDEFG